MKAALLQLQIGDVIHNKVTCEAGRIVRTVEIDGGVRYVVAKENSASGREIEALWRPREVEKPRAHLRKSRASAPKSPRPLSGD